MEEDSKVLEDTDLLNLAQQIVDNSHHPSSMVVIRNKNSESSIVFPPAHHENLHLRPSISTGEEEGLGKPHCPSSYTQSSCSCSCSSSENVSALSIENEDDSSSITPLSTMYDHDAAASRAKDLTIRRRSYVDWVYFRWKELSIEKIKGMILKSSLFTSVLLLGYAYFQQRRLNVHQRRCMALHRQSREKDQRISQLLNQITRLNEVMVILQKNSATTIKK